MLAAVSSVGTASNFPTFSFCITSVPYNTISATDSTVSATDNIVSATDSVAAAPAKPATRPLMRDIFATMPETQAPLVTRNNRLDCIDFIENDMEARVRNTIDEYVTLESLTPDYARFRTSASAFLELKLVADSVVCVVHTVETGRDSSLIRDSRVAFFTPQWEPLPTERYYRRPAVEAFLTKDAAHLSADEQRVVAALHYFCPMQVCLSATDTTITIIPQTGDLEPELRDIAKNVVGSITLAAARNE